MLTEWSAKSQSMVCRLVAEDSRGSKSQAGSTGSCREGIHFRCTCLCKTANPLVCSLLVAIAVVWMLAAAALHHVWNVWNMWTIEASCAAKMTGRFCRSGRRAMYAVCFFLPARKGGCRCRLDTLYGGQLGASLCSMIGAR